MNKKPAFSLWRLSPLFIALFLIIAGCSPDPFFIPVSFINGVPNTGTAGTPLILTGTVNPSFASNNAIVWLITDAGTTGAVISGNILNVRENGTVLIRAKIVNGTAEGKDYTQDFTVVIGVEIPTYKVSFQSNGGSAIPYQRIIEGQPARRPGNPARARHSFVNWYDNEELSEPPYNFNLPVIVNITLYAKWIINTYNVTFDSKGGSITSSQNVDEGDKISKPTDPHKDGYRFDGWYKEEALTNPWNFVNDTVTGAITLYAKWIPVYTVTFEPNGGNNAPASQSVEAGGYAQRPNDPVKTGYGFVNWYSNSGLTTVYNFNSPVTGNVTLYAKWIEHISGIAIKITGPGTGEPPDTTAVTSESGVSYTTSAVSWSPNDNPFRGSTQYTARVTVTAKTDSRFLSPVTAAINGETATIISGTATTVTLSYTFAPTSAKAVNKISIKTQPTNLTYTNGDTLNLSGLEVTLTYNDNTTEDVAFADFGKYNISASPDNNTELSHTTHNNKPVNVSIGKHNVDTNNLTVIKAKPTIIFPTAAVITYGKTLSESKLTGGSSTPSGEFKWVDGSTKPPAGNNSYNVEFEPTDKENYDYSSSDWTWNSVTGKVIKAIPITVNKADGDKVGTPIVTGHADSPPKITVTPLDKPGSGQSVEYAKNTTYTAPSDDGWQDITTFGDLAVDTTYYIFARSKANDNYYAGTASGSDEAHPIKFYSVTFIIEDGSTFATQNVLSGGNVTAPTRPTGYVFDGWYKEAELTNEWNFSVDTVNENTTLYTKRLLSYELTLTFEQISEQAPTLTVPTISRSGANGLLKITTVTVSNPSQYDTDSIKWSVYGTTETGDSITLDSMNFMVGKHYITLEVKKDGVPYSRTITFEVVK